MSPARLAAYKVFSTFDGSYNLLLFEVPLDVAHIVAVVVCMFAENFSLPTTTVSQKHRMLKGPLSWSCSWSKLSASSLDDMASTACLVPDLNLFVREDTKKRL